MNLTQAHIINEMINDFRLATSIELYYAPISKKNKLAFKKIIINRAAYIEPRLETINKSDFFQCFDQIIDRRSMTMHAKRRYEWIKELLLECAGEQKILLVENMDTIFFAGFFNSLLAKKFNEGTKKTIAAIINSAFCHIKAAQGLNDAELLQQEWMKQNMVCSKLTIISE
jgi:hypothetical protein